MSSLFSSGHPPASSAMPTMTPQDSGTISKEGDQRAVEGRSLTAPPPAPSTNNNEPRYHSSSHFIATSGGSAINAHSSGPSAAVGGARSNLVLRQQTSQPLLSKEKERNQSQYNLGNSQLKKKSLTSPVHSPTASSLPRETQFYKALLAESRSKAWGATCFSLSWICYGCATMWLGLVIILAACTATLLWTVRHEALEDFTPVECGPTPIVTQTLATIGFGSCNKHDEPQAFWETVAEVLRRESTLAEQHLPEEAFSTENAIATNGITTTLASVNKPHTCRRVAVPSVRRGISRPADAFVWLGDVVYLDGSAVRGRSVLEATEIAYSAMDVPIKGYENASNLYYRAFKKSMAVESSAVAAAAVQAEKDGAPSTKVSADESSLLISGEPERDRHDNSKKKGEEAKTKVPSRIIGTWDDHDMGINDGGKEFPYHSHTRGRFLDFLDISETDGLRKRDGIYSFHMISASDHHVVASPPSGSSSSPSASGSTSVPYRLSDHYENAFCIILLDVRTHRDPLVLSREGDMLGETQWKWFEHVLKNNVSDGDVTAGTVGTMGRRRCAATIIGSGIQHLSSEKPTEQWWNFKQNRQRLWRLLRKYKIGRAALISGDIHLMELVKAEPSFTGLGYPMIDFTSSGLTHQSGKFFDTFTTFRKYLTRIFPMAISCTPRGLTPVGNDDVEGLKGRRCYSAFDLLPDWIFETIFPPMDWRVGHYLGRNVGAISLQVSLPSTSGSPPAPELSLRFAGYALSLNDRKVFLPWRYESEVDEPSRLRDTTEEGARPSDRQETLPQLRAHAVTRHDQPLQVLEYLQPLRLLEIDSDKSTKDKIPAVGSGSDEGVNESSEFDKSNHHWWKTITFASQSFVLMLSSNPRVRNLGVVMGFAAYLIPLGVSAVWLASFVVRSCRGFETKRRAGKFIYQHGGKEKKIKM